MKKGSATLEPIISENEKPPPIEVASDEGVSSPLPESIPLLDFAKLDAFANWITTWQTALPADRALLVEEGVTLAVARRPEFKALIVTDPQQALARAVSRVVRQDLPEEIVAQLEKPVSAQGALNVYFARPAPGAAYRADQLALRYFETAGDSYRARVFGALEGLTSRKIAPFQGVAVDAEMAVAENAVRRLESGERIPAGTVVEETCPVSGETTTAVSVGEPVTPETPVVEIAGRVISLCEDPHAAVLEQQFRVWVEAGGSGGAGFFADNFPGTAAVSIGNLRCLYIRGTYPDQMAAPNTEEQAHNDMRNSARFFLENSYGKLTPTTTVTPLVTLPQTMAWYIAKDAEVNGVRAVDGLGLIHNDARAAAREIGYDPSNYDCIILRVNGGLRDGFSWGGGSSIWLGWDGMDVINHEAGHSLGLSHANFWLTTDATAYGSGTSQEYGNPFDIMGGSEGFSAHYNTVSKRLLGWLTSDYIHEPKTNGVYRIHAYDQPQLEEGKRYALAVFKDRSRQYNLEYHPARGGLLTDAALVIYNGASTKNAGDLVDTTPDTPYFADPGDKTPKLDAGIALGRTFSDPEADMHFTVIAKNATSPPSLDVVYQRGPFPGNNAPGLALNTTATNIAVNGSVTFTAVANDADGDALAYYWEFDDGVSAPNSSEITRTFTTAAQITAMVTVSDMKGGTARRHVVINVGAHGRQTVTGNITLAGQPLANVRLATTGGKFAYTDAAGNYALAGVSTGNQTLTAFLNGYTFAPAVSVTPFNVVAGNNIANWTATASGTFVTLTKTADATEGGANGNFTLTRTGATAAPLVVRVSPPSGSAAKPADYNFAPDHVDDGNYRTFTIPAGQASLNIVVTAVNDVIQEGPETIRLQLASNGTYLLNSVSAVEMTVNDNDTALPQVSVVSNDPYAAEFPVDSGSFTFTRTGPTVAALNLTLAWSGTATSGTDIGVLPGNVTIPAGQTSSTLVIVPVNDATVEGTETVIATISANAPAYVIAASPNNEATVRISDDDVPVVTVSVPDAAASEAGMDTGLFLLHRSGSTAAALKVYYGVHGTALHGTDYAALSGEVVIPAGASTAPVVITPYDDDLGESAETVILTATTFNSAYSLGPVVTGTVVIADNADLPVVSVRAGAVGTEGGTNATLIFRAVGSSAGNVIVNYSVAGTAISGTDFTALAGTVSIPANGINDVTVTIPITNDAVAEATETVVVTLTPAVGYRIYSGGSAQCFIRDNDSGGERVAISAWNHAPSESGVSGTYYFSRSGTVGDLVVNYAISGTAENITDFANLSGSVTIPDGLRGVDLVMFPVNDPEVEGIETVTLTVLGGATYSADRPSTATFEIIDNEAPAVTVGFQTFTTLTSEVPGANGEFLDIPLTLSAASATAVTVQVSGGSGASAQGDDVDWSFADAANGNAFLPTATVTFPPNVTVQSVRLRVKNDNIAEIPETIALELSSPRGARLSPTNASHQIWIYDGAVPANPVFVTEERWYNQSVYTNQSWGGSSPDYTGFLAGFSAPRDVSDSFSRRMIGQIVAPATGTYTFWIASDDSSRLYLSTSASAANKVQRANLNGWVGPLEWDKNASQKSVGIPLVAGQSYYMEVQHQEGGGGDHVAVAWEGPGLIRQEIFFSRPDESPRTVRLAMAASTRSEADGAEPLLMVLLNRPAGVAGVTVDFTVGGTATAGSDYTLAPGTLVFAAGEQVKHLPLAILADAPGEAPEAIVVSIANPTGAALASPTTHVITVQDAETPTLGTQYVTASSGLAVGTVITTAAATPAAGRNIVGWVMAAGNTGNAFAINAAGQISLVTPAALPNPGGMQLVVRATDDLGSTGDGLVNIICNAPASGVAEQRWNGSAAFESDFLWTGTASYTGTLATFTTPQSIGTDYSRRLTGYLKPSVSGDYTFWIAGDDGCRLYLSNDGSPANKLQIATVVDWTGFQVWDKLSGQMSVSIPLVAGKVYWMDVHQREGLGGDHVSVAWQGPGIARQPIPASVIFPYVSGLDFDSPPIPPTIVLTSPATGAAFDTGSDVAVTANIAGGSPAVTAVEFYRGSTLIGSDSSVPYGVTWTNAIAGNYSLTARAVYSGGGVTSSGTTISVTDPIGAPKVWSNASGGSWPVGSNWAGGTAASGADVLADFSTLDITADRTVTLDGSRSVGHLSFGNTASSHGWTLAPGTGGALTLANTLGSPSITTNATTTLNAIIDGAVGFTKSGASSLTLSNIANTLSGNISVTAGELRVSSASAQTGVLGTLGTGAVTVDSGATLRFFTGSTALAKSYGNAINLNTATLIGDDGVHTLTGNLALIGANTIHVVWGSKNLILAGVVSGSGTLAKSGGGDLIFGSGGTTGNLPASIPVAINGGNLGFNRSDAISLNNNLSGVGSLRPWGSGTTTLTGNNTYGGHTWVQGGGTLVVTTVADGGGMGSLGTLSTAGNSWLGVRENSTLRITGTGSQTTSRIVWNDVGIGAGTFDVVDAGASVTFTTTGGTLNRELIKTGAGALTLTRQITATGAVTVNGGSLTLLGLNTYTGDTQVIAGTLSLAQASLANLSAVRMNTGATLNLPHGIADTVAKLYINGIQQPAGTYTSGNSAYITGSGSLAVTDNPPPGYAPWIGGFFNAVTDPLIIGPSADPDADGVPNLIEFLTCGLPNDNSQKGLFWIGTSGNQLVLSLAIRGASTSFSGTPSPSATVEAVTAAIQGSLDLGNFNAPVSNMPFVLPGGWSPTPPPGHSYHSFKLDASTGLLDRGFLRFKANQP